MVDTAPVITVVEGDVFQRWLGRLRDYHAVARINARLRQITAFEDGAAVVVLLCGGDKGSQQRDIRRARRLVEDWR